MAKLPGRPTCDCLFSDPARDGKSLLKIWNVNEYNGVVGLFNCQGAGELVHLAKDTCVPITLKSKEYGVLTVVSVKEMSNKVAFASIGLTKMFDSGGAIKEISYELEKLGTFYMKVRGCGPFGAYSSVKPKILQVDSEEVEFEYAEASGFSTFDLKIPEQEMYLWNVVAEM
ncbi:hypothetical protein BUALT_Bualt03G0099400 [Buddleja alternifolia]|uniref:Uncharacterized protein n=1 Tax=Buddleja alternifolia TaxID=168488 RepID=A0AAV6XTP0_9LAMI|nr:hypothetical protein BUALT_Bualt03G0099400 [Buddleja alternifolia]